MQRDGYGISSFASEADVASFLPNFAITESNQSINACTPCNDWKHHRFPHCTTRSVGRFRVSRLDFSRFRFSRSFRISCA